MWLREQVVKAMNSSYFLLPIAWRPFCFAIALAVVATVHERSVKEIQQIATQRTSGRARLASFRFDAMAGVARALSATPSHRQSNRPASMAIAYGRLGNHRISQDEVDQAAGAVVADGQLRDASQADDLQRPNENWQAGADLDEASPDVVTETLRVLQQNISEEETVNAAAEAHSQLEHDTNIWKAARIPSRPHDNFRVRSSTMLSAGSERESQDVRRFFQNSHPSSSLRYTKGNTHAQARRIATLAEIATPARRAGLRSVLAEGMVLHREIRTGKSGKKREKTEWTERYAAVACDWRKLFVWRSVRECEETLFAPELPSNLPKGSHRFQSFRSKRASTAITSDARPRLGSLSTVASLADVVRGALLAEDLSLAAVKIPVSRKTHRHLTIQILSASGNIHEIAVSTEKEMLHWSAALDDTIQSGMKTALGIGEPSTRQGPHGRNTSSATSSTDSLNSEANDIFCERENRIQEIARSPGNDACADCGSRPAQWASITFGIFICVDCSGHHRNLGSHISMVRSLTLDVRVWDEAVLSFMSLIGNVNFNNVWEARLRGQQCTLARTKPCPNSPTAEKQCWIEDKYKRQLFKAAESNPRYADYKRRLRTFTKNEIAWPHGANRPSPEECAAAGLFFDPKPPKHMDVVKCFACGCRLYDWKPGDDPMHEHRELRPDCPHLLEVGLRKSRPSLHARRQPEDESLN